MNIAFDFERKISDLLEKHPELNKLKEQLNTLCAEAYDEAVYDCDEHYRTHDDKYDDGYSVGFSDGFDEGFSAGYNEGYDDGHWSEEDQG